MIRKILSRKSEEYCSVRTYGLHNIGYQVWGIFFLYLLAIDRRGLQRIAHKVINDTGSLIADKKSILYNYIPSSFISIRDC